MSDPAHIDVWLPVSLTAHIEEMAAAAASALAAHRVAESGGYDFAERSDSDGYRDFVISAPAGRAVELLNALFARAVNHGAVDLVGDFPTDIAAQIDALGEERNFMVELIGV